MADADVIYNYIHHIVDHGGTNDYTICYVDEGYLHNGDTTNPIRVYYYDENYGTVYISCTVKDFDITSEDYWADHTFMYYQGQWIQLWPSNDIGDLTLRIEEGRSSFAIYEWNEEKQKSIRYEYASTYNPVTYNDQTITVNYGDMMYSNDSNADGDYQVYAPPGVWLGSYIVRATSSYYYMEDEDEYFITHVKFLGGEYNCHYLGENAKTTGSNPRPLQDGDIDAIVIVGGETVTARDFDRVQISGGNYLMYFDGVWYNTTARKTSQLIADMAPTGYGGRNDEVPEISAIIDALPDEQPGSVNSDRLMGLNIDTLTINGVTTQVELFDTIRVNEKNSSRYPYYTKYFTYCPGGVWMETDIFYEKYQSSYIPVRGEALEYDKCVELKWEDPNDITTYEPTPATWEGTIVIRKEDSAPKHRWDGVEIIDSTTRDKYKTDPYRDEDIQLGKTYYYGFFPYYTATTENGHPIKFYRFTAVRRVDTGVDTNAPIILSAVADGTTVTVSYKIPMPVEGEYNSIKLYGKIGSNPKGDGNDDVSVDIDRSEDEVIVENLQPESTYYFAIITIQGEET